MRLRISISIVFLFFLCCRPAPIHISPLPSQIEYIEGYASLRVSASGESSRSKFAFLFHLPHQGHIDVSDILGRTIYQIIINKANAFLVVPSKKVYWQGSEEEIIERFLGFRLSLGEVIGLLTGKWHEASQEEKELNGWVLKKDKKGRIKRGQRGGLTFEIIEFIEDTPFAYTLIFKHQLNEGRLKILRIELNRPAKIEAFMTDFLKHFEQKQWAEIQELLKHED